MAKITIQGLTIAIPDTWIMGSLGFRKSFFAEPEKESRISLPLAVNKQKKEPEGTFQDNLHIDIQEIGEMTLQGFVDFSMKQIALNRIPLEKTTEQQNSQINGIDTVRYEFIINAPDTGEQIRQLVYYFVHQKMGYIITGSVKDGINMSKGKKVIEDMIFTFALQ